MMNEDQRHPYRLWAAPVAAAVVFCVLSGGQARAAEHSDLTKRVGEAMERGVRFLWSKQKADGSWPAYPHEGKDRIVGPTSMAVTALLECGASIRDPRIVRALAFLAANKTTYTYELALRCQAYLAAYQRGLAQCRRLLARDAATLWKSGDKGYYHYNSEGRPDSGNDNSNSQYAVLGVWAAVQANIEVPAQYWPMILGHWSRCQRANGGWPYNQDRDRVFGTMTAAGVATLFVCFDQIYAKQFVRCRGTFRLRPLVKGLEWLEKNFPATITLENDSYPRVRQWKYYYLYNVERVGLASGYKYFGKADWYKLGAEQLLKRQKGEGDFHDSHAGEIVDTGYALLFFQRGRRPIVMNKLEFNGDWNNRPRDLANLTRWLGRVLERPLNWQIVNLRASAEDLLDAPILYISGAKAPTFSDSDVAKLRNYVLRGGMLFSCTECGGRPYSKAVRELCVKLFPQYELKAAGRNHEIYSRKLSFALGGRPKIYILSNGVRPLVIHTEADLPRSWQLRNVGTGKMDFAAAANVVRYAVSRMANLRYRGESTWPEATGGGGPEVKLVRLSHKGNWNPEPMALQRLALLAARRGHANVKLLSPKGPAELGASGANVAVMTGTGALALPANDAEALKQFVAGGGTLVLEAAGGSEAFDTAAHKMIERLYPRQLARLSSDSLIYGGKAKRLRLRRKTSARTGNFTEGRLWGVRTGERWGVLLSREDISGGLLGSYAYAIDGYMPDSAYEIMKNILLGATK